MLYRLSGFFLVLSSLAGFIGQAGALRWWEGSYLLSDYLISDLGLTRCAQIRDSFGARYICSPGHDWFNYGTILAGILLTVGGLMLMLAGSRATRRDTAAGYRSVGNLLIISGIALSTVGLFPHDINPTTHDIAGILRAVALWFAMIIGIRATSVAPSQGFTPILHGGHRGMSIILLVMSFLGFLGLVLLGTSGVMPGLLERLSFDMLSVWVILLGIALWRVPTLHEAEQRKRRHRNELDARRLEHDDAIRKAVEDLDNT